MDDRRFTWKLKNVRPDQVPLSELAELLCNIDGAMLGASGDRPPAEAGLSLVQIEASSTSLAFAYSEAAADAVDAARAAFAARDATRLVDAAQEHIRAINGQLSSTGWVVEVTVDGGHQPVEISAEKPVLVLVADPPVSVRGPTSVFGEVVGITGQQRPKVQIHPPVGRLVEAMATKSLAREIGRHLYETVEVTGTAVWLCKGRPSEWPLSSLEIDSFKPMAPQDLRKAFRDLAEAAGSTWSGVDAEEWVHATRHGGAE